jgi:hypothetical protein
MYIKLTTFHVQYRIQNTEYRIQNKEYFLGPNGTRFAHSHFRAQKNFHFQGQSLPMGYNVFQTVHFVRDNNEMKEGKRINRKRRKAYR